MADAVLAWLRRLPWRPTTVGTLGFSQGGALATHLLRQGHGIVSFAVNMSGFATARPPAYWGRGAVDPFFTPELIHRAEQWLPHHTSLTGAVYPGLGHSVSDEMLRDVAEFLRARR